jgi:hypothetical protein
MRLTRISASIALAGLAGLCQCSLLVDLSGLASADGGPEHAGYGNAGGAAGSGAVDADAATDSGDGTRDPDAADGRQDGTRVLDADASGDGAGAIDAAADVSDAGGPADGEAGVLGLVALYPFDETSGTTAADTSGNNHTAIMAGATFAAGLQGNAATMNGTTQYVILPIGIVSGLTSYSIATWVRLSADPAAWTRIFDFGTGTTTYMFLTTNNGAGTPLQQFAITTTGAGAEQRISAPSLPTGTWQHVAVTWTGNTGTLYVNGVPVAQNQTMTLNPNSLGHTTQSWLGRSEYGDPYFNGQIDNFRIYNRALSAFEVQQLFQGHQ